MNGNTTANKQKNTRKNQLKLGKYYRMDNGEIAHIYGAERQDDIYTKYKYQCLDIHGYRTPKEIDAQKTKKWVEQPELTNIPGDKDPRIPYEFDLNYDLKTISDLQRALTHASIEEKNELHLLMKKYNISL